MRDAIQVFASRPDLGGRLVLIDHCDSLPPVLRGYATRLDLAPPDDKEIEELIKLTIRRVNKQHPIEASMTNRELVAVVRNLRGLSRRQIERVIAEVCLDDKKFDAADLPRILDRKRQLIRSEGLLEFVQAPPDMSHIGGLDRLKLWLKQREQALGEEARKFGIESPRGILMLGVQGAGKSLCAKAVATAWKRPLMRLDPGVLYDRFIGESERRLRDALQQAELMAPVVLWIDEIEKGFASAASRSIDGGLSQRMFGTLLTWMQEHQQPVFLAATANDIEALPPELLRKGRFDEIFFVDLPGEASRRVIAEIHLRKRGRDPSKFDSVRLATASDGYSGAEIEQAIVAALHEAFSTKKDVTTELIEQCLRRSPPLSVTMAERLGELRRWAKGRCVPAE
jgi:SpoVK/Ycf46/Vps4 family AAA+-type ATPase